MNDVNLQSIESNRASTRTRSTFDWTATAPSTGVVETLAAAKGVEPTTIEPLSTHVDLEALDSLLDPPTDGSDSQSFVASFSLPEWEVLVHADGTVEVTPNDPR